MEGGGAAMQVSRGAVAGVAEANWEGQVCVPDELPTEAVVELRGTHLPPNLKVQYSASWMPGLHMVRGSGSRLFTVEGDEYLDCVNNVAHVGHCHPKVVAAAASQLATLNTNTRYLGSSLVEYARRLSSTMPDGLEVVYMVTSGSEANDLALRLVRAAAGSTGAHHIAVLGSAYHGHTLATLGISPYKFEGRGGFPCPSHVHVIPCPDAYRCLHTDGKAAARAAIQSAAARGGRIAAFFFEPMSSCGGQVVFPDGFISDICNEMAAVGAICVSDEVQVGFGRLGSTFWGFQAMGVIPEIVTMGKGIGNGFPVAAVVTTPRIATAFANGMEYFNTTGGCTAACAAALAVLDVISEEKLQENAQEVGGHLLDAFRELATKSPVLGDVRGSGLFLGLEVVMDKQGKVPAPHVADWVVAACMTRHSVLLSTDGPCDNVIKFKPPMCFSMHDAVDLVEALVDVLLHQLPSRLAELLSHDQTAADTRAANAALKQRLLQAFGPAAAALHQQARGSGAVSEGASAAVEAMHSSSECSSTVPVSPTTSEWPHTQSPRSGAALPPASSGPAGPAASSARTAWACLPLKLATVDTRTHWAAVAAAAGLAFCCGVGIGAKAVARRQ